MGAIKKLIGFALLLLVGCAHYQAKPIALSNIAQAQAGQSLAAPCIAAAHVAGGDQWLEAELIAAAECFNPSLARAKAATQLAAANGSVARQYPGLALVISTEYARNAPEASKWLRGLSLDIPIDFGVRKAVRLEAAAQMQLLSTLENLITQRAVAAEIGLSIDAIRAAQQEEFLLQLRATQQQDWLKFVAQRIVEGQISQAERLKPQQDLLATQALLLRAQAGERIARGRLALALGVPLSQVLSLKVRTERADAPLRASNEMRRAALLARPELLRALGQYQLSELALRLEVARQYPDIRLIPGYIWERGLVKLPLALSAALPPLDGNRNAILVAEAARELAARELELIQANITNEIDVAVVNLAAARAAYTLGLQQLQAANMETSAARAGFAAGQLDQLGRLSAELHLSDIKLTLHTLAVEVQRTQRALSLTLSVPPVVARPKPFMESRRTGDTAGRSS